MYQGYTDPNIAAAYAQQYDAYQAQLAADPAAAAAAQAAYQAAYPQVAYDPSAVTAAQVAAAGNVAMPVSKTGMGIAAAYQAMQAIGAGPFVGVVKRYNPEKGYGFIACTSTEANFGQDVFLHRNECHGLAIGSQVQFSIKLNAKGQPQAVEVVLLASSATAAAYGAIDPSLAAAAATEYATGRRSEYGGAEDGEQKRARVGETSAYDASSYTVQASAAAAVGYSGTIFKLPTEGDETATGVILSKDTESIAPSGLVLIQAECTGKNFKEGQAVTFQAGYNAMNQPQAYAVVAASS